MVNDITNQNDHIAIISGAYGLEITEKKQVQKFQLIKLKTKYAIENDGSTNFVWTAERSEFSIQSLTTGYLELRLGYPIEDIKKTAEVFFQTDQGEKTFKFKIRSGWKSYFFRFPSGHLNSLHLIVHKPLIIPDDNRYLGVMLSYAAIVQNHMLVKEIAKTDNMIDCSVKDREKYSSAKKWSESIQNKIFQNENEYYAEKALEPQASLLINDPVTCYSVLAKREKWISDNVRSGSTLLEIGCGRGGLSFLTEKNIKVVGIDLSEKNAKRSLEAGYSETYQCSADNMPFEDETFDYVVSLDVMGHIPIRHKNKVLSEIHRVLKPDGIGLHAIETDDFDPVEMRTRDYARMVLVDGHIGIEPRAKILERISNHFTILDSFLAGNTCMSSEHWLRAHYMYGLNLPAEYVQWLINLSDQEKIAFDMGVGWTFWRLLMEGYDSKDSGGLLFVRFKKAL